MQIDRMAYGTDERAEQRVHEPQAMTKDELLQWYMEQPKPFRTANLKRIRQLSQALLISAIYDAVDSVFPDYTPARSIQ